MTLSACQSDATLRQLDTRVVSCVEAGEGFHVVLEDTVLYAEGGGQPADHGTIAGVPVRHVFHQGDVVVHEVASPIEGQVRVQVDWARRWDHMQQHTGQHLLTAVAQRLFGWQTTSFHLYQERCDIEVDGEASAAQLAQLEEAVNAEILAAHPVTVKLVTPDELDGVRSRGLPEGFVGPVRLIDIDGVDVNTCGGTHVAHTGELQVLKLLGTERVRGGTRLFFVVGDRVRRLLQTALAQQAALTAELSCGPAEHLAAVQKLQAQNKAADKAKKALLGELAAAVAVELIAGEGPVLALHREDADMAFLNQVASRVAAARPEAFVVLTAGQGSEGSFVVVGPAEAVTTHRGQILELLGGRGGGPPGRLQGRASQLAGRDAVVTLLS